MAIHVEEGEWNSDPGLGRLKLECEVKGSPPTPHKFHKPGTNSNFPYDERYFTRKGSINWISCEFLFFNITVVRSGLLENCAGLKLSSSFQGLASCTARGEGLGIPALHLCVCSCAEGSEGPSELIGRESDKGGLLQKRNPGEMFTQERRRGT